MMIQTTFVYAKVVFTFCTEVSLKGIYMQFMVLYFVTRNSSESWDTYGDQIY